MSATMMSAAAIADEPMGNEITVVQEGAEAPETGWNEEAIARLAYALWQARGCPDGSPEEDWFRAEEELRASATVDDD